MTTSDKVKLGAVIIVLIMALSPDGRWLFRAHGSTVFSPVQGVR